MVATGRMLVWARAGQNLKGQLDMLKAKSGKPNLRTLAKEAGFENEQRLSRLIDQPHRMLKAEERLLMAIFRKYGLTFDTTLGMGGV